MGNVVSAGPLDLALCDDEGIPGGQLALTPGEHRLKVISTEEFQPVVVALTPEDELVMVRQYRHGEGRVTLEIPGGLVDPGESAAAAAARELLEETGYRAGSVAKLGVVNPNPALFGNRTETYVALGCERVAEIANGHTEETVVELVPLADLRETLRAGRVTSALVIAALYWFELEGAR